MTRRSSASWCAATRSRSSSTSRSSRWTSPKRFAGSAPATPTDRERAPTIDARHRPNDLDRQIDRAGTGSVKFLEIPRDGEYVETDAAALDHGDERLIQLWVADMDFAVPREITDALHARVDHPIYGYSTAESGFYDAVIGWCRRRHGWEIEREWIGVGPGVIPSLYMLIRELTEPGEGILIQPPVYPPFAHGIEANGRRVVENPLRYDRDRGHYEMDFDDLARKLDDPTVRMVVLCSPHNPMGRVWTRDELARFAELCLDADVTIVSDEIHRDLIFAGHQHVPLAAISSAVAERTITTIGATKSFNLAGLKCAQLVIPNPELRSRWSRALAASGEYRPNAFGIVASEAAYNHGDAWLDGVMAYVQDNFRLVRDTLAARLPALRPIAPEGTYLLWLDATELALPGDQLCRCLLDEARVHLNDGAGYGPGGEGFLRLNLASPRATILEAFERIIRVLG